MRIGQKPIGDDIVEARENLCRSLAQIVPPSDVPALLCRLEKLIEEKIKLETNQRY